MIVAEAVIIGMIKAAQFDLNFSFFFFLLKKSDLWNKLGARHNPQRALSSKGHLCAA